MMITTTPQRAPCCDLNHSTGELPSVHPSIHQSLSRANINYLHNRPPRPSVRVNDATSPASIVDVFRFNSRITSRPDPRHRHSLLHRPWASGRRRPGRAGRSRSEKQSIHQCTTIARADISTQNGTSILFCTTTISDTELPTSDRADETEQDLRVLVEARWSPSVPSANATIDIGFESDDMSAPRIIATVDTVDNGRQPEPRLTDQWTMQENDDRARLSNQYTTQPSSGTASEGISQGQNHPLPEHPVQWGATDQESPPVFEWTSSPLLTDIMHFHHIVMNSPQTHLAIDSSVDEDALPVDDLRRTYDFTDFVDEWWRRSMGDRSLPSFKGGARPTPRHWQPPQSPLSRSCLAPNTDIQGIRWHLLGPSREDALLARRLLHPSKRAVRHQANLHNVESPAILSDLPYVFRNFVPKHRAMFSHYQLRSLLAASGRHHVFYAAEKKIWQTALSCPSLSKPILDLTRTSHQAGGFQITCLAASQPSDFSNYRSDHVLLAGGFDGQFALLNLDNASGAHVEGALTHASNGLVTHIHCFHDRRSGLLQAPFCSNEGKIRLMDVRTQQLTKTFDYNDPINCSATSTDGRLRVVVGDSRDTLITSVETGSVLVTLRQHEDHGFACAWSPDGRYVATGAQDNQVITWDARNWSQPLAKRSNLMSCARSLHFTSTGALVVAENEDVVSVYDGPNLGQKQDLRFFGSIAGVALINGGEEIVVANCDRTVGGLLTFEQHLPSLNLRPAPRCARRAGRRLPRNDRWSFDEILH